MRAGMLMIMGRPQICCRLSSEPQKHRGTDSGGGQANTGIADPLQPGGTPCKAQLGLGGTAKRGNIARDRLAADAEGDDGRDDEHACGTDQKQRAIHAGEIRIMGPITEDGAFGCEARPVTWAMGAASLTA